MKTIKREWEPTIESETKRLKGMMQSCFAYDSLSKDNSYIAKYEDKLGTKLFDKVYAEHLEYLTNKFEVKRGVHTDHEGLTYNSLVEIIK